MNKRIRKKKGLSKITTSELMDLDYAIADFILPRLIRYKEKTNTSPWDLTFEESPRTLVPLVMS